MDSAPITLKMPWFSVAICAVCLSRIPESKSHNDTLCIRSLQFRKEWDAIWFIQSYEHIGEGNGTPLQYSCPKIPWTEEPGRLQSMGLLWVRHDWVTSLSFFTLVHWRRKWQPTPVFLPGESWEWGSLVGCCLGVAQSQTRLKRLSSSSSSMPQDSVPIWVEKRTETHVCM